MQHLFVFVFSSSLLLDLVLNGDGGEQTYCNESYKVEKGTFGFCRLSSCAEYRLAGFTESGIYKIYPKAGVIQKHEPFEVFCDMETDGGGWTVFQRRDDYTDMPRLSFIRNWNDYSIGFGNLLKEFWLGNKKLSVLTNQDSVTLRVELEDFEYNSRFAIYDSMIVADEQDGYRLQVGTHRGDTSDALIYHSGFTFVTYDRDRDNCANLYKGGWWYNHCHWANLNGRYLNGPHDSYGDGINWKDFKGNNYSLKKAEMKMRPSNFKAI